MKRMILGCQPAVRRALNADPGAGGVLPRAPETAGNPDQYRELFERSADAILIIDRGRFIDCNRATVRMLGYRDKSELLQTHPSDLSPDYQPDGRASYEKADEMIALAMAQGSHRFEWDHRRADGSVFPVEVLLTAVPLDGREILHVVWRDITERRQLEIELRHAQKMEAIGRLTGGIAHDFNNLLVAISGYAELLEMELPADSRFHEYVQRIIFAGDRAAGLIRQLLAFSRKQILLPEAIELNRMLQGVEQLLGPVLGEAVKLECRYSPDALHVMADPGRLEHVVLNLAANARDAMPDGGQVVLATRLETVTAGPEHGLKPGSYAVLSVSDTGEGIAAENLDKIFEPFFSTKELHRGTGLGLATVHGIIKQSGGDLRVSSTVGNGATFAVYLPLTDRRPEPEAASEMVVETTGPVTTRTVLVVEDEAAVLDLVRDALLHAGYEVHAAASGREALALVAGRKLVPDLLLTEVEMPGMGGAELATVLREQFPDLNILFTSGYQDQGRQGGGDMIAGVELLQKPFGPKQLRQRVQRFFGAV